MDLIQNLKIPHHIDRRLYVEGACVNYKDTLAGNIENKTTYKINNLGISGSSSIYQFKYSRNT